MTKEREALQMCLEYIETNAHERKYVRHAIKEALALTSTTCEVQPEQEPLEYWNAVEGWVKIDEVRKHFEAVSCGTIYKNAGEGRVPLYTAPPKRELKSTTDMMMELADRLGELPDDVDPRAWEHLLVYAPKQKPVMEYDKEELRGTFWDTTSPNRIWVEQKREWVGLTDVERDEVWRSCGRQTGSYDSAIEAKLKELNHGI